ncbi:MAG: transglutaminase-like domain-containing protein [Gudongella sp.]|nr:transglutaminase-like domain-containing protein [Gudongella sp.]
MKIQIPPNPIRDDNTEEDYQNLFREVFGPGFDPIHSTFHLDGLTGLDRINYINIRKGLLQHKCRIRVIGLSLEKANHLAEKVLMDNPLIFWCTLLMSEMSIDGLFITPFYDEDAWNNRITYLQKVHNIYSIFNTKASSFKDPYEIELLVHDAFSNLIRYTDDDLRNHSILNVLIHGQGVCDAISYAVCYLMLMFGIDCSVVSGDLKDKPEGEMRGHAWNLVKIDGEWYHLDVTNDLQGNGCRACHWFFNLNDDMISLTHVLYSEGICTSLKNNYYVRNKSVFNDIDSLRTYTDSKKQSADTLEFIALWPMSLEELHSLNLPGWISTEDHNRHFLFRS